MTWDTCRLSALDFETTGTDPWTCRPVTVAMVVEHPGLFVESLCVSKVINCGEPVPIEAAAVHGFTTERVQLEGEPALEVMKELAATIAVVAKEQVPLCIMNARFDWPLFVTECIRHNITVPPMPLILDPGVLDKGLDRFRKGKRKLQDLCFFYGVTLADAHTAAADARATIALTRAIFTKHPHLQKFSPADIMAFQHRTSQEFVRFLNQRRDPAALIPQGWPVPERADAALSHKEG